MLSKYYVVCLNYAHCRNVVGFSFIPGCEQPWNYWRQSPREGLQLHWQNFFLFFSQYSDMLVALQKNCGITYMQHFNRKCARTGPTAYVISTVAKLLGKPDDVVGRCEWERVGGVNDDTVIFSNLPVYYARSACVFDMARSDQCSYIVLL